MLSLSYKFLIFYENLFTHIKITLFLYVIQMRRMKYNNN